MAFIALKWFAGMVPRYGSQHLKGPHATEAENCNLYSGELRPLTKPALAHKFCQPDDSCFRAPIPEDPSVPPEPPPEPPKCVVVSIVTQPTNPDDWSLVEAGTILTLSVVVNADATSPIQYQWLKNSQAIPGAVDSVLTYAVQDADDYASFTVFVQNPCGQEISLPFTIGLVTPAKPCIYYECDAYDTVVLGGTGLASYTMLNENVGLNQVLIDQSGPTTRNSAIADVVVGPFFPADLCTNNNSVFVGGDGKYRILQNGSDEGVPADTADPEWAVGFDDITAHGVFHLSNSDPDRNGALISFYGLGFPYDIDCRLALESDGLGHRMQLAWIGQAGGNQPRYWTSDKLPITSTIDGLSTGDPFWWGVNVKRTGSNTNAVVSAEFYFCDLKPGSTFQRVTTKPAGTVTGALWRSIETTDTASCRVQALEWGTINGSSFSGNVARLGVEFGALTDERLASLTEGWLQNQSTYVDPNPDCLPATCNQYACDALETAITALSPDSHYKMTDPVNDRSGTTVIDSGVNGIDLPQVQGNAVIYDYTPPPLPGSCSGTAFWSTSVNSAILDTGASGATPPTYNNLSGEGTIIALWSGLGQGQYNIYWRDSNSTQMLVRLSAMNSSGFTFGMESLVSDGAGTIEINAWPLVAPVVDGGTLVVITFKPVGATTDILVYGSDGVLLLNTNVDGTVGTFGTCYRQSISFTDTAMQNMAFKQAYSDAATVQTILDSYAQNQVSYVDPRTGCIPP